MNDITSLQAIHLPNEDFWNIFDDDHKLPHGFAWQETDHEDWHLFGPGGIDISEARRHLRNAHIALQHVKELTQ